MTDEPRLPDRTDGPSRREPAERGSAFHFAPAGEGDGEGRLGRGRREAYPPEEEIGLDEIWAVLRRRWWIVGLTVALALGAAWWYTARQVPQYRASALVRVEDAGGGGSGQGEGSPLLAQLQGSGDLPTEMAVVETYPILAEVAEQLDLNFRVQRPATVPRSHLLAFHEFGRGTGERSYRLSRAGPDAYRMARLAGDTAEAVGRVRAGDTASVPGGRFAVATDSALRELGHEPPPEIRVRTTGFTAATRGFGDQLRVTRPDPEASLFRVEGAGPDPYLLRSALNGLTAAFIAERQQVQNREARRRVQFLEDQGDRVEQELEQAEQALQEFREREQVVAPEAQAQSQVQQFAGLEARRSELVSERDALQSLLQEVRSGGGDPNYRRLATFPPLMENSAIQSLLQRLLEAEAERSRMLSRRTRDHPDVVALTGQIEKLEAELGSVAGNFLGSLNEQIASLDAQLARYGEDLEQVPSQELQLARLERRTELLTELRTRIQTQLQQARISASVEASNVRVVEPALVPGRPVSPSPSRNLAFGGFLGLVLGVGLAFVREYTDRRIHDEEDVDRSVGLPVLGRVPRMPGAAKRERMPKEALVTKSDGTSSPAESFRTLRTNVRYARGGSGAREIVVTSPGARDGKSTTAGNLAVTFAQQGNRTLLVDADLRKPVQHRAFEVDREPGLSELLVGEVSLAEAVARTDQESLWLLPAGRSAPNPAELLDSGRMDEVIESAREAFGAVVFDTPPALVVTDASVLGRKAQGVLLVVRADRTDRRGASETRQRLEQVGAAVLGVVFNDADRDGSGYYGRYYHEYYGEEPGEGRSRLSRLLPFG